MRLVKPSLALVEDLDSLPSTQVRRLTTTYNSSSIDSGTLFCAATAQANLIKQTAAAQQSVSGVNLNEEYVSLSLYQEQYQASARIIDVASTVFDTLLGLRG